jgi:hypothetical protein
VWSAQAGAIVAQPTTSKLSNDLSSVHKPPFDVLIAHQACDLCRKRKRRCLWNSGPEGCTPCINLKETCSTTHIRKPRAKPQRGSVSPIYMFATADGRSNRIAEYENKIHRLESMLQEHNAAQPDMEQQPLQPADTSVPAAEWVTNLRNHLPTLHRPDLVNFEELYTDSEWHDGRWLPQHPYPWTTSNPLQIFKRTQRSCRAPTVHQTSL